MMCSRIHVIEQVGLRPLFEHCPERAHCWLVDPDGQDVPGGHYCATHGQGIIEQYRVMGDEIWTLRDLTAEEAAP